LVNSSGNKISLILSLNYLVIFCLTIHLFTPHSHRQ
jgi:hypothetical protein